MTLSISDNNAIEAANAIHNELGARVLGCTLAICELFQARGENWDVRAQLLRDWSVSEADMSRAQAIVMEYANGGVIVGEFV